MSGRFWLGISGRTIVRVGGETRHFGVLTDDVALATADTLFELLYGDDDLTAPFFALALNFRLTVGMPEQRTSQDHCPIVPIEGIKTYWLRRTLTWWRLSRVRSGNDKRQIPGGRIRYWMRVKREYRDRAGTEVAVLDALVDRADDGMTVFELRAAVEAEIDDLEEALSTLKADGLIVVDSDGSETVIKPDDQVVPDEPLDVDDEETIGDWIRDRFPF